MEPPPVSNKRQSRPPERYSPSNPSEQREKRVRSKSPSIVPAEFEVDVVLDELLSALPDSVPSVNAPTPEYLPILELPAHTNENRDLAFAFQSDSVLAKNLTYPYDIDTIRCELQVSLLHILDSSVIFGGVVGSLSCELSHPPYLLVSSHPVYFVHCGDRSIDTVRDQLVRAVDDYFLTVACTEPPSNNISVPFMRKPHKLDIAPFIHVLQACNFDRVYHYVYNLKTPVPEFTLYTLPKLVRALVPNTFITLDLGVNRCYRDSSNNSPAFTLFSYVNPDRELGSHIGDYDAQETYATQDHEGSLGVSDGMQWKLAHQELYVFPLSVVVCSKLLRFPMFGELYEGNLSFELLPKVAFQQAFHLRATHSIPTKIYSCITHLFKADHNSKRECRGITPLQVGADLDFLSTTWPKRCNYWRQRVGENRFQIRASSYRIEYTVTLQQLPSDSVDLCVYLTNLCRALDGALLHNSVGIHIQHLSFADYLARCTKYSAMRDKIHRLAAPGQLYVLPLYAARLAHLRNVHGIVDPFVLMHLRTLSERPILSLPPQMQRIEFLWSDAAQNSALSDIHANHTENRVEALRNTYRISLATCRGDAALLEACKKLHPIVRFAWQHGNAKSAKFMVWIKKPDGKPSRTPAYQSAAELLCVCAKLYLDRCRQAGHEVDPAAVFTKPKKNSCEPDIVFV